MKRAGFGPRRTRLARSGPPTRKTRVKPVNRQRKARTFQRTYGSHERVQWITSLPCAWCGMVGRSDNAHTVSGKGMGRKADANTCAPLCRGCHERYDRRQKPFDSPSARALVQQAAERTDAAWHAIMRNP